MKIENRFRRRHNRRAELPMSRRLPIADCQVMNCISRRWSERGIRTRPGNTAWYLRVEVAKTKSSALGKMSRDERVRTETAVKLSETSYTKHFCCRSSGAASCDMALFCKFLLTRRLLSISFHSPQPTASSHLLNIPSHIR